MKRIRNRRGQSILEYLVVVTIVILAVLGARAIMQAQSANLMNESAARIGTSTNVLGQLGDQLENLPAASATN